MKRYCTLLFVFCSALHMFGEVGDLFSRKGIQYQVTKEDPAMQSFEVSTVHYDSAYILLPDSISNGVHTYAVTDAIQWYNSKNCGLKHYDKIDMSEAKHITRIAQQISALIAIDTLILPPNLQRFPMNCYTSDTITYRNQLMDEENLLPGIHRIWSTGTQADENLILQGCTSLQEADLSTYTTTNRSYAGHAGQFAQNPFLTRLVLPNTITVFYNQIFDHDPRLAYVNIPDSLEEIYATICTKDIPYMDTLRLGKKVHEISYIFADGWYTLRHIEVDSANQWFMDDNGVLYTKNQHCLFHYPYSRDGSEYQIPSQTDTIGCAAFCYGGRGNDDPMEQHARYLVPLADSASLKTVVCHPGLKSIEGEWTFFGSSVRTMSKFGETQVKSIPWGCFMYSAIDSITLPFGLEEIGHAAFSYTYNLKQVMNLPRLRYLRTIGENAFRRASQLRELDFLACDKVLELPKSVCQDDSLLQFVSFPRNVQSIGDSAFAGCVALRQIVCPAVTPISIDPSVFEGVDKQNCVLRVPARSLFLYQNAPVWQEFFHIDTDGFYYIETAVSDSLAGFVTGGGAYMRGDMATISAEANKGYRFVSWSDGYLYSTRIMTVTKDESFTAIFEPIPVHTLTVVANDDTMGSVTGSGEYEEGAEVTLTATPNEGYCLLSWSFSDQAVDTILYTIPASDTVVTANFAPCEESFESVKQPVPSASKILRNTQILILRGDKTYTLTGTEVK